MQPYFKTFIAATLAMGALSGASAQQRIDSSGIKADELTVQLMAGTSQSVGGSGTMCGVLSYVNSGLTGNEPCAGIYLNAAWPSPQCPEGHRKIQISGSSQGGNIFGGGSSAASYSCMIQPAGAAPWVQNAVWQAISTSYQGCELSGYIGTTTEQQQFLYSDASIRLGGLRSSTFDAGCTYTGA